MERCFKSVSLRHCCLHSLQHCVQILLVAANGKEGFREVNVIVHCYGSGMEQALHVVYQPSEKIRLICPSPAFASCGTSAGEEGSYHHLRQGTHLTLAVTLTVSALAVGDAVTEVLQRHHLARKQGGKVTAILGYHVLMRLLRASYMAEKVFGAF